VKAQHPEFELWSQGVHAQSGVACADCHMPYMREGATKVTDHYVRSPLLNVSRSCLQCHHFTEKEMLDRVKTIQDRTHQLLDRAENALVALIEKIAAAKKSGASDEVLAPVFEFQRKAQWRVDFINAENSMGFHAPQEVGRILGEAIDYARQGEVLVHELKSKHSS
jgi:nitrite reductase (cytochrome c-552)